MKKTGFCLRLQVESTQMGPIGKSSHCLLTSFYGDHLSRFQLKSEAELIFFLNKRQDDG
jgi:hypothetical protein